MQRCSYFLFHCPDDQINGEPDYNISYNENGGKNKHGLRKEGNPRIDQITPHVGGVQRGEAAKQRFEQCPGFNLVEDRRSCLQKCQKICGNNGESDLPSGKEKSGDVPYKTA